MTTMHFFKCKHCSVCFQFPFYSEKELEKYYIEEFESFMLKRSGSDSGWDGIAAHIAANKSTYTRRMSYLSEYIRTESRILEVGCSSGFMLLPLKDRGCDCIGVEPSDAFRAFLNSRKLPTYASLDELPENCGKFDVVCHFFVLEHVSCPLTFIQQQIPLCETGGVIVFEVPASSDALVQVYDMPQFERFYWSKPHPWYFDYASLDYLLKSTGCKYIIKPHQRYDLSNHISWALTGRPGGQSKYSSKLGHEIEDAYKDNLIRRGYYDTLIAVLKP